MAYYVHARDAVGRITVRRDTREAAPRTLKRAIRRGEG
jgi:hypothetical protein